MTLSGWVASRGPSPRRLVGFTRTKGWIPVTGAVFLFIAARDTALPMLRGLPATQINWELRLSLPVGTSEREVEP
jgi:hypothetical protein